MMIKNKDLLLLAVSVCFLISACTTSPTPALDANTLEADSLPSHQPETGIEDPADTAADITAIFALKTSARNTMDMVLGKIAQENGKNLRVKKFGLMMLKDHTRLGNKLNNIAQTKHILIPTNLPAKIQSRIEEIKKFKGAEFDRRYMILMADNHQKDIDLFEKTARGLQDTAFRNYIIKTLPVLKMHLDSAKSIKNEL